MLKNPLSTLVLGLLAGLVLGYGLAEQQSVPLAVNPAPATAASGQELPEGHPPMGGGQPPPGQVDAAEARLQEILENDPENSEVLVALGNLSFDGERFSDARKWYERSLEIAADQPRVITDLAIAYRRLGQPEKAISCLDRALGLSPELWQANYAKVLVLYHDLGRNQEAAAALEILQGLAANNSEIPDLTQLKQALSVE